MEFAELLKYIFIITLASMFFSFGIAFPVIAFLYKFKITRRMTVDFTTLIEKRNLKIGVPIMGGLIVVITVLGFNLFVNPFLNEGLLLILFIFLISAALGGIDDVLNIYGTRKPRIRSLALTWRLMKVHKDWKKRIWMFITFPWEIYKKFFHMLGSNPGTGIQAHEKIIVQSIAGLLLGFGLYFFAGNNADVLNIPFLQITLPLGWLIIPFAWITVVLMTNAVNLADGMDGLAASELMTSFLGFLIIAILKQLTGDGDFMHMIFLIATVLGSLITYLYFNIPPARFQMGDVGSLAMGTLLAGVAFILREPLMLLIIAFPFVITLLSTVIQGIARRLLGRRAFRMAPIHYHFQMKNGWSEEKVVMRFGLFSLICMIFGIFIFLI